MYSISQAAKLIGVSPSSLRRWDRNCLLKSLKSKGGHRRYRIEDLQDWLSESKMNSLNEKEEKPVAVPAIYARVSGPTSVEEGNLDRQVDRLIKFVKRKYGPRCNPILIREQSSGLNAKRPGLWRLIKNVEAGKVSAVICSYRDRVSRYGIEFLEELFNVFGFPLIVVEQGMKPLTLLEELLQDFMNLLACFSGKMYKGRALQSTAEERMKHKNDKFYFESINKAVAKAEKAAILGVFKPISTES